MLNYEFARRFNKQYRKLDMKIQLKTDERIFSFLEGETDARHNLHLLTGQYLGMWSINITGDYRAIFSWEANLVIFEMIGTHSQLYG